MRTPRECWILAASLGSLACIGLVWLFGFLAAPVRHGELARVVLMADGREHQLSGASFQCDYDPDAGARVCSTRLNGRRLALLRAADGCKAKLAGVSLPCRLDYGLVAGFPSVRLDAPDWTVGSFARTKSPHLDFFGTLSECAWGRIAQGSGVLVPLLIVLARAQVGGRATRRQWAWRIFAVLASISPLWIAMLWTLLRWRYLD